MEDPTLLQLVVVGLMKATVATIPLFLLVLAITGLGRRWLAPWARQTPLVAGARATAAARELRQPGQSAAGGARPVFRLERVVRGTSV